MKSYRVTVKKILSSRYDNGVQRPLNWDQRISGVERIETECGKELAIFSNGQQSTPQVGWELLVNSENQHDDGSVEWTLFGMPKGATVPAN